MAAAHQQQQQQQDQQQAMMAMNFAQQNQLMHQQILSQQHQIASLQNQHKQYLTHPPNPGLFSSSASSAIAMGVGGVGQKRSYDESRPATAGDVDVNAAGTKIGQSGGEVSSSLETSAVAPSLANRDSSSGKARGQIKNNDSSNRMNSTHSSSTTTTTTGAASNATTSRMERKRKLEKQRRMEMNERLDELARVLDLVELPITPGRGRGMEVGGAGGVGGTSGDADSGNALNGGDSTGGSNGSVTEDKSNNRVNLLARTIQALKNLRHSYDCRTAEVMKLALKMQHGSMQQASQQFSGGDRQQHLRFSSSSSSSSSSTGPPQPPQPPKPPQPPQPTIMPPSPSCFREQVALQTPCERMPEGTGVDHQSVPSPSCAIPVAFHHQGSAGTTKTGGSSAGANVDNCIPMMMVMPVWLPAGTKAVPPQVVPVSAELMGLFSTPDVAAAHLVQMQQQNTTNMGGNDAGCGEHIQHPPTVEEIMSATNVDHAQETTPAEDAPAGEPVDVAVMAHCA